MGFSLRFWQKQNPHTNKKLAHVDIFAFQIISIMGPNTSITFSYYLHGFKIGKDKTFLLASLNFPCNHMFVYLNWLTDSSVQRPKNFVAEDAKWIWHRNWWTDNTHHNNMTHAFGILTLIAFLTGTTLFVEIIHWLFIEYIHGQPVNWFANQSSTVMIYICIRTCQTSFY